MMQSQALAAAPPIGLSEALRRSFHHHRHLAGLVAAYFIYGLLLLGWFLPGEMLEPLQNAASFTLYSVIPLSGALAVWSVILLARERPVRPIQRIATTLAREFTTPEAGARVLPGLLLASLMIGLFVTLKAAIPAIQPFHLDRLFIDWDLRMHGGRHPWEWLHPLLGYPGVTLALDRVYYLWFPVLFVTLYWQLFTARRPQLRLQFLLAFFACWIVVGSIAALLMSSAGPCFLAPLLGEPSAYDGLMAYLRGIEDAHPSMTALNVQDALWRAYSGSPQAIEGISAMPSMHVSIAILLALLGWRINRFAGLAYSAFAILIFLGSIHLGFHYAVDGYIAAVMTVAIWWGAGAVSRRA